jgi:2-polyprenyl-3-methyl-5-hydroxy-6-metoxy-1,4-benzoquinol methylase
MYAQQTTNEGPAMQLAGEAARCILCGGTSFARHFPSAQPQSNGAGPHEPYRITHSERRRLHAIVRCASCGLVMLPAGADDEAQYEDAADPYYVEQADERIANAGDLLDLVPRGGRLLEIGCACGFLLVAARERGFSVTGVEMSKWASEHARSHYGLDVRSARLEDLDLPASCFDVAVMSDVIEHLTEPRRTLAAVSRLLAPGGRLLLLTPDIGSVTAKLAGQRWWGLLDDHYFYYSRATLARLLESEGFAVERIVAQGRRFRLSHWVFKLSQYSAAVHGAASWLARALGIDEWRVPINLGDQMACVARKK